MRTRLTGYFIGDDSKLLELNKSSSLDCVISSNIWYLKQHIDTLERPGLVKAGDNYYKAIPSSSNNTYNETYEEITINSANESIDMASKSRFIKLILTRNSKLTFLNVKKAYSYFFIVDLSNYKISNLHEIVNLPIDWTYEELLSARSNLLFELYLAERQYFILGSETIIENPSIFTYTESDYLINLPLDSDSIDISTNSYSGVEDSGIIYKDNYLHLTAGKHIVYAVDSNFNFNQVDFALNANVCLTSTNDYGSILSKWTDSSKQFWLRLDSDGNLLFSVNEGNTIVTLSYNLTSYLSATLDNINIFISRVYNIYSLYINGELVDNVKSTNSMVNSTANFVIGYLESSPLAGDIGNTSFTGKIKNIWIGTILNNNYAFYYYPPIYEYLSDVCFHIQHDLINKTNSLSPTFTSNETTTSHITQSDRRNYPVGNYDKGCIDSKHHFEYTGDADTEITGDVTIEAWIKNISGNQRGTIIYHGNSNDSNYHFGLYDGSCRIDANNESFTLSTIDTIPDNTWVHVAFVRQGSNNSIYINGARKANSSDSTVFNAYSNSLPICIKRTPSQDAAEATANTTLYPSKSLIEIEGIRITKRAIYSGTDTINANFDLPSEL